MEHRDVDIVATSDVRHAFTSKHLAHRHHAHVRGLAGSGDKPWTFHPDLRTLPSAQCARVAAIRQQLGPSRRQRAWPG